MSSERSRQIEALYHAARQATPDERAALLSQADAEVRHEVELLLSNRTQGEFLDRPAVPHAIDHLEETVAFTSGVRLGPYRIENKLGAGGMGGLAYLEAGRGWEAAAEFQKVLDHRGIVLADPIGALARLQLGRALALLGETDRATRAYQDFLAAWKHADSDIPLLRQARAEYGKL